MSFKVGLLVVGYFVASVLGSGADVVLSCSLVEEGMGAGGFGGLFSRTPATLVLRELPVVEEMSTETITPYNAPTNPDPNDIIFETKVASIDIPESELLLHADCNEQEVTCEISPYFPQGTEEDSYQAYFIGSVQLEGGGISLTLVLRTLPLGHEGHESVTSPLMQKKLGLPLSQSGTLLTEVAFLVFSRTLSVMAPIGGEALLDCGFKLPGHTPEQEIGLEWRLQHKGHGRRILEMKALGSDEGPTVTIERDGSSVEPALALGERNVSLSLINLNASDEGTYICTVMSGLFQAQQVMQLHVVQPPRVSLSVDEVVPHDDLPQRVSCHCERYYPLDVQVEWLSLPPGASEPIPLSKDVSLSSHRQYSDGTLSLSSYLTLWPSDQPPGTTITCQVSHHSLATPLSLSFVVSAPKPGQPYLMIAVLLGATLLFVFQMLRS
uniref:TAP binding protein like n=1 Tax=Paramormyrops kingsleyae TaxID=1676925 RepID=A0A3B3S1P9_9TELE